ncbi:MAG: glycosyltransferase [Erysipelotrichaceae bacterium]|nr:glycosyltransferase [Erysipelotrichaceae bacterium]
MEKIKVLIIAGAMNVGGIENQLMHLLRKADKSVFQIDYTTTAEKAFYEDEMIRYGSECIHIPRTGGKHFYRYCKALYKIIREGDYDIVHSHELFHSGMVLLTARLAGVQNRFVHAHNWMEGDNPNAHKSVKRILYNHVMQRLIQWNATEFIACSSLAGEFLFGRKVINKDNYHLVFNSVDTNRFIDNYGKKEIGDYVDDEWTNVIQIGRFTPVKNQLFTVEIANELRNRGRKIRFLLVGNTGGTYDEKVKRKIEDYGLEEYVHLLGIRKDIDSLMRKSSAFLLPSLYEGMPLVLIEAQASGLPCVVADTFSHEVDFHTGSIHWLKLEDGLTVWCDSVEKAVRTERVDLNSVKAAIEKYGFDSDSFARKVCQLYEKSVYGKK